MSTIVVVKKDGYAAIAADTLTKWGSIKESAGYVVNHQKIVQVGNCYLAAAGPTVAIRVLTHYFAHRPRAPRLDGVDQIFEAWLDLHAALKERYHVNPEEEEDDAYESSQMDVLIAGPAGIFGVGADRAVQEYSRYYAYGYGCEYALGAMYAVYDDPARSAEDIAKLAVQAAAEFDDNSGLPLTCYTVKLRGAPRRR